MKNIINKKYITMAILFSTNFTAGGLLTTFGNNSYAWNWEKYPKQRCYNINKN